MYNYIMLFVLPYRSTSEYLYKVELMYVPPNVIEQTFASLSTISYKHLFNNIELI